MIKLRKIFFYLFLTIYIGFCPLVILYALGLRVNTNTKSIQKTGIISVSTIPPEADVTLNQRHFPKRTPTIIRNLPPGNYSLTLSLKNYLPWKKTLTVKEKKATTVENVLLIPQKWKSRELFAESFEELIPITGQPFLLLIGLSQIKDVGEVQYKDLSSLEKRPNIDYLNVFSREKVNKKGPLLKDIFIFRWSQGIGQALFANNTLTSDAETIQPIFQKDFIYREGKLRNYYTSKNSPFLLLPVQLGDAIKYLWIDPRTKPPQVEDITDLFPMEPDNVLWDPREDKLIFSRQRQSINRLNIKSKAILPNILEAVRNFSIFGDQLYVLTNDYTFKRVDSDAKNVQILLEDSPLSRSLFGGQDELRRVGITVLTKELILFLDENGALLFNHLPHRLVDRGVKGFVFNEHKKRLLIWTNQQIGVIDFTKEKGNALFEQGPPLTWPITNGNNIQQAFWVNETSQILYRDEDKIFLLEADEGESLSYEIIGIRPNSAIEYSDTLGTLFYLDKETGHLSSIEILKIPHAI